MTVASHSYGPLPTADPEVSVGRHSAVDMTEDEGTSSDAPHHDHQRSSTNISLLQDNTIFQYPPSTSANDPEAALAEPRQSSGLRRYIPSMRQVRRTVRESITPRGPTFIQRAARSMFPQYYTRVATEEGPSRRAMGGGLENDGVFANVMAKPSVQRTVVDEHGDVHIMPEDAQRDAPPSYITAQADSVPPYHEVNVMRAPRLTIDDDPVIEGLPCGSLFSFAWNFLISFSFQFVGFLLTYLLHTTHAAKYGARAGLGVTLIQYGLYSHAVSSEEGSDPFDDNVGDASSSDDTSEVITRLLRRGGSLLTRSWMTTPNLADNSTVNDMSPSPTTGATFLGRDWFSFLLMTVGWFLLLSSILGFARIKRMEKNLRRVNNPVPPMPPSPEAIQRDRQIRQNLERVFGIGLDDYDEEEEGHDEDGYEVIPAQPAISREEEELRRDLIAAGLI